jgi:hypothetical protein
MSEDELPIIKLLLDVAITKLNAEERTNFAVSIREWANMVTARFPALVPMPAEGSLECGHSDRLLHCVRCHNCLDCCGHFRSLIIAPLADDPLAKPASA